ncbi:MAG: hypothetical protein J6Q22_13825, partial [Prevotella sp.]|nr:hypothetical protein [Prevotella sp.]
MESPEKFSTFAPSKKRDEICGLTEQQKFPDARGRFPQYWRKMKSNSWIQKLFYTQHETKTTMALKVKAVERK